MEERGQPSEAGDRGVRWQEARLFLRSRLARHLDRADPEVIEDLTQEALIRLLRAVQREPARNLEALMTEIAHRTYVDHVRRRRVQRALLVPADDAVQQIADPSADVFGEIGDPVRRVRFIVVEFFRTRHAPCLELAESYFAGQEWVSLAAGRGMRPEAVRQQWLRCVTMLRGIAKGDKGLLGAWAQMTT